MSIIRDDFGESSGAGAGLKKTDSAFDDPALFAGGQNDKGDRQIMTIALKSANA
mgnify:CR=1 FL=1